ncbi:secretin N-terminal domain-containing protein [Marinicella litoralis]|uniref:General secretion pathway protein D n=1 Tax=Marinicella litoralis TaxID=644220 RepID=A0A4R6Y182_9GAMM|nr:secretin N-terminal domain-containing protein [Marinicella litoralis]TDR22708.1 general secretion pathway protein D [Marinicella litoralis]
MKKTRIIMTAICGLLLCSSLAADNHMHTLNLQDTEIRLLVETISDITGKNFVIDPEVTGKITVISGQPIPEDKVYDLFLSILSVNGFTTETQGDTIKIIPVGKSNPLSGLTSDHPDQLMTKIFRIKHIPVEDVMQMLKSMNSKAKLISNVDSNILIASDKKANVDKMEELINNIDRKSDSSIELISIKHANAADVAETLTQLLDSSNALGPQSKIVPDSRTNSVIVNANPSLKSKIMNIIAQLDVPLDTNTQAQVVHLKFASAETLVPILETMAKLGQGENDSQNVSIQAHNETNSLVINAPPAVYRNVQQAIAQLDIRRQQVLIEAIIAEVSVDNSKELGVDWFAPIAGDSDDGLVGGSFTGNNLPNLSADDPLDVFGSLLSGGLNLGYLNFGTGNNGEQIFKFGGLLKAIGTNGNNNILSTPSVVTLNHQEASLSVGQEVPFVTGQFSGTGSSNSEGSPNPFTTIQREDVGLSLTVTPHINEGGQIVVDIAQEISSIDATAVSAVDLVTKKRTLSTSVMIPDDSILVLGGLIDDSVQESIKKVPLLGDIPLIKNLFRTKKRTRVKRNLMIFIHPKILKDNLEQEAISKQKYNEIRQQQLDKVTPEKFRRGEPLLPEIEDQQ